MSYQSLSATHVVVSLYVRRCCCKNQYSRQSKLTVCSSEDVKLRVHSIFVNSDSMLFVLNISECGHSDFTMWG